MDYRQRLKEYLMKKYTKKELVEKYLYDMTRYIRPDTLLEEEE